MKLIELKNLLQEIRKQFMHEKVIRVTPQDREYEALRENMRRQFTQLKEKGLSIRIVTL